MKIRNDRVLPFRTQLSLALLPIVVLPLLIIGYISYHISYSALQARSAVNVSQISSLVNENLDNTLQHTIQLAKTPLYNQQLQQIIKYYSQHPTLNINNHLQDLQTLVNFTLNILIQNDYIDSIDIYTTSENIFSETFYSYKSSSDGTKQPWFSKLMHTSTRTVILPTHMMQSDLGPRSVFSVAQTIVDTSTFQTVGAIVLNIDTQMAIEQPIATSANKSDMIFLIYSPNGEKIYITRLSNNIVENNSMQDTLQRSAQQALQAERGQLIWDSKNYFLSSTTSSLSGLTVATLVPSSSLMQDINGITRLTWLVIGAAIMMLLGSTFLLIHSMSQQVTKLRYLMKQVETGDLDARFQPQGRSEIALLGRSFNHMVTRLKQLIQDNYESQLQRKKAELAALQSQINPHFLYNTLGTLQMIALTEGQDRLASMVYELGQLMRYSLETDDLVDLKQELKHACHFLYLLKERYEERLNALIHIEDEVYHYKIPKFTLQPLIENAVYYGIEPKVEGGTIQINGYRRGQDIVVVIIDDGVGIPTADLHQLQQALRYESNILKRSKHIGILNVQARIQRTFGPEYGLTIEPGYKRGTKVMLCIPSYTQHKPATEGQK